MSTGPVQARLSFFQKQVLAFIEGRARLAQGFCLATRTIADHFGVKVRYVQVAIARLIELGKIAREWDYGLRTRRRFRTCADSVSALQCAQSALSSALTTVPPLDSPIRTLERSDQESGSGEPDSPPPSRMVSRTEEKREEPQTPEVAAIVERVAKAVRPEPRLAERVAELARSFGMPSLAKAVERLERRAKREPIRDARGYLAAATQAIAADGGPTPEVSPEQLEAERKAKKKANYLAACALHGCEPEADYLCTLG